MIHIPINPDFFYGLLRSEVPNFFSGHHFTMLSTCTYVKFDGLRYKDINLHIDFLGSNLTVAPILQAINKFYIMAVTLKLYLL